MLVGLCLMYTFFPVKLLGVEISLLIVLIGSVGLAAVYLSYAYRRHLRQGAVRRASRLRSSG